MHIVQQIFLTYRAPCATMGDMGAQRAQTVARGVRWPLTLCKAIEAAAEIDNNKFSGEVVHLVELGLKRRAARRTASRDEGGDAA